MKSTYSPSVESGISHAKGNICFEFLRQFREAGTSGKVSVKTNDVVGLCVVGRGEMDVVLLFWDM